MDRIERNKQEERHFGSRTRESNREQKREIEREIDRIDRDLPNL